MGHRFIVKKTKRSKGYEWVKTRYFLAQKSNTLKSDLDSKKRFLGQHTKHFCLIPVLLYFILFRFANDKGIYAFYHFQ